MSWRLIAFLPPAFLMTGIVLLTAAYLVSALESSLETDPMPTRASHPPAAPIAYDIEDRPEFFRDDIGEDRPAERATFVF